VPLESKIAAGILQAVQWLGAELDDPVFESRHGKTLFSTPGSDTAAQRTSYSVSTWVLSLDKSAGAWCWLFSSTLVPGSAQRELYLNSPTMTSRRGQSKRTLNLDLWSAIKIDPQGDKAVTSVTLVHQMDNRCHSVLWPLVPTTNHRWSNGGMIAGRKKNRHIFKESTPLPPGYWVHYCYTLGQSVGLCSISNFSAKRNDLNSINDFPPLPPHVPYGLRGLPSRLWPKCNRLLRLGRSWGAVTLSRWSGWWYMNMR
jgi:hypothetical protein